MFVNFRNKKEEQEGTPKKKKKLNQSSTYEEDDYNINTLTRKKSFVETFQFIGNIKRKDSTHIFDLHKKRNANISDWDDLIKDEIGKQFKIKQFGFDEMDEEKCADQMEEDELIPSLKLSKKMTMMDSSLNDVSLKLYKHNSTIDADERVNEIEEGKYGQNMYIQQITSIKRNSSKEKGRKDEMNFEENEQMDERLLQDYQIKDNINCHIKHHENYVCLNKLDKIFYYVKKINFSEQMTEEEIHQLCNMQIKLYNKDDSGHLIRFYQSWIEDISIYLIFQLASTSLLQKTINGLKMRENQVWALLKDCCESIEWIKSQENENSNERVAHLNIKPGNILKCRDRFKLSDPYVTCQNFQKIISLQKNQERLRLNFSYTAPQLLIFKKLLSGLNFQKADMYSLGICIIQNLTGLPIYLLDLKKIRSNSEKYLKGYSHALRKLLIKMISLDPNSRPYPSQISMIPDLQEVSKKKEVKRKLSL